MSERTQYKVLGALFCLIGLALGIGIAVYHPDSQSSPPTRAFAILAGLVFFLPGLHLVLYGTALGKKLEYGLFRVFLFLFGSMFLLAPWAKKSGALVVEHRCLAQWIATGIVALFVSPFFFFAIRGWKKPAARVKAEDVKQLRKRTGRCDDAENEQGID